MLTKADRIFQDLYKNVGPAVRDATPEETRKYGYVRVRRNMHMVTRLDDRNRKHCEGGEPAYVNIKKGEAWWCIHGTLHREDGPAYVDRYYNMWYRKGKLHREDGPAVVRKASVSGITGEYYINGRRFTKEEYEKHFNISQSKFRNARKPFGTPLEVDDHVYESKFRKLLSEMTEQSYWLDPKSHSLKKGNDHEVMVEKDPEWFGLDYEDLEGMPPKAVALQAGFVRIDIFPDWVVLELPKKPDGKLKNALSWFAEQMLVRYNVRSDTPVEIYVFNSSDRRGTWNGKFGDLHSSAIFEGLNEDKIDKQIKSGKISGNPNSKELLKILERLGATIEWKGSDEYLISHPLVDYRVKMSTHRRDTPWGVIDWINKLIRKKKAQGEL